MGVTQYIGARYMPIFADPPEHSSAKTYEPLTIVLHEGNSYTSKQFVPKGIQITNETYWAETGNYNAQVEAYRREVLNYADSITAKAFAFDTVADMQANDALYAGAICHTDGFYTSGDGGAGWYTITNNGTANGMDVIACGNLFANLIIENRMKIKQFGARGNGIMDDSTIIQYAFETHPNTIFIFDNGNYLLNKSINITPCVIFDNNAWLVAGRSTETLVYINKDSAFGQSNDGWRGSIFNIRINGAQIVDKCLEIHYMSQVHLNIVVWNFNTIGVVTDAVGAWNEENTFNIYANAKNKRLRSGDTLTAIGADLAGDDNIIENLITINCLHGCRCLVSNIQITQLHCWLFDTADSDFNRNLYPSSCVLCGNNAFVTISEMYQDGTKYGVTFGSRDDTITYTRVHVKDWITNTAVNPDYNNIVLTNTISGHATQENSVIIDCLDDAHTNTALADGLSFYNFKGHLKIKALSFAETVRGYPKFDAQDFWFTDTEYTPNESDLTLPTNATVVYSNSVSTIINNFGNVVVQTLKGFFHITENDTNVYTYAEYKRYMNRTQSLNWTSWREAYRY